MKNRQCSIDLIRTLAMILVIIVHTKSYFFSNTIYFPIFSVWKVAGTIGVPLFVMLTGYLMFRRNFSDTNYLKRYIYRNFFPLLIAFQFWNIIWNLLRYTYVFDPPQKWSAVVKAALFMGDTLSALWYLPMTIALYLGMPILSIAFHQIHVSAYRKIIAVALLFSGTLIPSVAPILSLFGKKLEIHSVLRMNIFGASVWGESVWMIYLLAGYYISQRGLKKISSMKLGLLGVGVPFGVMYFIEMTKHSVQHYDFVLVVVLSISVFELLTRTETFLQKHPVGYSLIEKISEISFAIYMMHVYVCGAIVKGVEKFILKHPITQFLSWQADVFFYLVFILLSVFFIGCLAKIMARNRIVKKYLFLMK